MKYWFIINPVAGKGKFAKRISEKVRSYAESTKLPYEICLTSCHGDATRIAREICERNPEEKVVFACGGDGIVSEVAGGLAGFENVSLGIIPGGTGNDFVKSFGGYAAFSDLDAQTAGESVPIDAIHYTGDDGMDLYSVNVLNMGFDCHVVACTDRAKKIPFIRGKFAYMIGVLMALITKPGLKGELSIDGGTFEPFDLMFLLAANGRYYGGGYCPAPYAAIRDGRIDLCTVKNVSRIESLRLIGSYRKGTFLINKRVKKLGIARYLNCERIMVRFPEPTAVCGDGEIAKTTTLHAEICKGKLRLHLPRGCTLPDTNVNEAEKAEALTL